MRRLIALSVFVLITAAAWAQVGKAPNQPVFTGPPEKREKSDLRIIHGEVMDLSDAPLEKSVVYLKNVRTLRIITFITGKDGSFHFNGLNNNVDYEIRAEHDNALSSTRTISSLDGRKDIQVNLKVDPKNVKPADAKPAIAKPGDAKPAETKNPAKPESDSKPEAKKPGA
jgi:hypothetical protein